MIVPDARYEAAVGCQHYFKYEVRVEVCEHGGKQNQWRQPRI